MTLILTLTSAVQADYIFIGVSAQSADAIEYSVRTVKILNGEYTIGVFGEKNFFLKIDSSYPAKLETAQIFLSTGEVLQLIDNQTSYNCNTLMPYWCLAVARYSDGHVDTKSFVIRPAWKKGDDIPKGTPVRAIKPSITDGEIQQRIDQWWGREVQGPAEEWFNKGSGEVKEICPECTNPA